MKFSRAAPEKRTCDGIVFDSIAEMEVYQGFKGLQQRGVISKLQHEPEFVFVVSGVTIGRYRPDFSYIDENQKVRIVDVKGWRKSKKTGRLLPRVNREFGLKVRLMKACFGLEVELL